MRLASRILLPPFLLLAGALAGGSALYAYQRGLAQALNAEAQRVERAAALVGDLAADAANIQLRVLSYRLDRRQAHLDDILRTDRAIAQAIDAYALLAIDEQERGLLKAYIDRRNEILHLRLGLVRAVQEDSEESVRVAFERWMLQRSMVNATLDDLIGFRFRSYSESVRGATEQGARFMRWAGLGIVIAFSVVLLYALYVTKRVAHPLGELLAGIEGLDSGTLDARLEERLARPKDEIGGLARAFNAMAGRLAASYRKLEAEIAERGRAQEALRQAHDLLELRVRQRTEALAEANRALQDEVAERKRAALELRRRNEELAQFNYVASHDLQEPLRMVSGCVQLLARRYRGRLDAEADTYIGHAVEGAERMQSLIRNVLAYTLVGNSGRELRPVDANRALQAAIERLAVNIARAGATVTHDRLPTVTADQALLVDVFQALLDNALKFRGAEPPRIHVSASRDNSHWQFAVTDNGIGIEPQYQERIFRIFQRLHSREAHPGNGMGLALCRRIVERFGGQIAVESAPGRGATFRFTVPSL